MLDQVRWDDGPWVPTSVPTPTATSPAVPWDRDGMHSGVGGIAHLLAEIRLARPWTDQESTLAESVGARLRSTISDSADCTFFDGLVSTVGALSALGEPGVGAALDRLAALAAGDGWPQTTLGPPRFVPGTRINDLTLGTAGVLLGALWVLRPEAGQDQDAVGAAARGLAQHADDVLLREREDRPTGSTSSPWGVTRTAVSSCRGRCRRGRTRRPRT